METEIIKSIMLIQNRLLSIEQTLSKLEERVKGLEVGEEFLQEALSDINDTLMELKKV